ncbi:MAG: phage holin family protein [bacterium]|nr:phage holin family protein [bacterium]
MVPNVVIKIIVNAGALWAAARYIPGFKIFPVELFPLDFLPFTVPAIAETYLAGAIILAVVNAILHPILKVIGAALPLVTGAMLMVVLNIVLLYAGAVYFPALEIAGFKPLLWSGLLLGIVNTLL